VFGKEPCNIGLFCTTFDLRTCILLNGFNLPSECRVALVTVVLSESKPTDTQDGNKYGDNANPSPSHVFTLSVFNPLRVEAYQGRNKQGVWVVYFLVLHLR